MLLQRGRALSSAESSATARHIMTGRVLQRGRALSSAERLSRATPWSRNSSLQRGRALSSAESERDAHGPRGEAHASTGPRSFERGETLSPAAKAKGDMLQRGRALSSAERHEGRDATPLQWWASTGPRSFERGELVLPHRLALQRLASTGPRSFERGEAASAAESFTFHPCFNGAALFRARREAAMPWSQCIMRLLQRGRALSSAESQNASPRLTRAIVASTGPRSFERGEHQRSRRRGPVGLASTGPRSFERGE